MTNIILDKIKWVTSEVAIGAVTPICPKHHLELYLVDGGEYTSSKLICAECEVPYNLPRPFAYEKQYVLDKIASKSFKEMKFINLDDEAIPIAESKVSSEDNKYFVTSILTQSKVGLRLVVYAGEKGKSEKTQVFVEPEIKRLAFDQGDLHPTDVFVKLEATFNDGTSNSLKKNSEE